MFISAFQALWFLHKYLRKDSIVAGSWWTKQNMKNFHKSTNSIIQALLKSTCSTFPIVWSARTSSWMVKGRYDGRHPGRRSYRLTMINIYLHENQKHGRPTCPVHETFSRALRLSTRVGGATEQEHNHLFFGQSKFSIHWGRLENILYIHSVFFEMLETDDTDASSLPAVPWHLCAGRLVSSCVPASGAQLAELCDPRLLRLRSKVAI